MRLFPAAEDRAVVPKPQDRHALPSALSSPNRLQSPRPPVPPISRHPSQFSLQPVSLCKLVLSSKTASLEPQCLSMWRTCSSPQKAHAVPGSWSSCVTQHSRCQTCLCLGPAVLLHTLLEGKHRDPYPGVFLPGGGRCGQLQGSGERPGAEALLCELLQIGTKPQESNCSRAKQT